MSTQDKMMIDHPFNHIGKAPFKVVGIRESVIQHGDGSAQAGGTCTHCGTGVRYVVLIQDANGKTFGVGTECANKTGDHKIISVAKFEKRELMREKRIAKMRAEREAKLEAQKNKNPAGLTDFELGEFSRYADQLTESHRRQHIVEMLMPLADRIYDGRGGFRDSIAKTLNSGDIPYGRGYSITIDILAKQAGRSGSKKYDVEYAEVEEIFENAQKEIDKL